MTLSTPQTFLALLASAFTLGATPAPAQTAKITVQTGRALGRVNPLVFGSNIEAGDTKDIFTGVTDRNTVQTGNGYWDDAGRRPAPAVAEASRQAGVTLLRYPGGCLAHNFDWKKTVGPLSGRPGWHFGLDEYLTVCRQTGAQPLVTVSDYTGTPRDAADLVEYLNAPAGPRHPWAVKRARWGHPRPYHVRWFELGNESNHGNHAMTPHRQFTPPQYADYALATARAMRAVDPSVKIGIVSAAGAPVDDPWNPVVFARAGRIADFLVVHTYAVGDGGEDPSVPEDTRMQACLAAADQLEQMLRDYHASLRRNAGRDLPLAVTEYNAAFTGDTPKPYRYSLGAALFSADYVRVLLKPENNVLMANYWHFLNGYWGMVQGPNGALRPQAAWALFHLWKQHFGARLVAAEVESPRVDFAGYRLTQRAQGADSVPSHPLGGANQLHPPAFAPTQTDTVRSRVAPDGILTVQFVKAALPQYTSLAAVPTPGGAGPGGCRYHLSCEARWTPDAGSSAAQVGLGLMDSRGWDRTHSAIAVSGLESARDWTPYGGTYAALPDATGLTLLARAENGAGLLSGRLEVRRLRLSADTNTAFPGYSALTSSASLSPDGRTAYVIVFNKTLDQDLATVVALPEFHARSARVWTVNGPSLGSDNLKDNLVREVQTGVPLPLSPDGSARTVFAAHSMTAIEFSRTRP